MAAERNNGYRLGWTALTEEKAYEVCVGLNVQTLLRQTRGENHHNGKITESPQSFSDSVVFLL